MFRKDQWKIGYVKSQQCVYSVEYWCNKIASVQKIIVLCNFIYLTFLVQIKEGAEMCMKQHKYTIHVWNTKLHYESIHMHAYEYINIIMHVQTQTCTHM